MFFVQAFVSPVLILSHHFLSDGQYVFDSQISEHLHEGREQIQTLVAHRSVLFFVRFFMQEVRVVALVLPLLGCRQYHVGGYRRDQLHDALTHNLLHVRPGH